MIPIRDENPTRTTPYVVYFIIALNVFAFLIDFLGRQLISPPGAPPLVLGGLWKYSMIPAAIVTGQNVEAQLGPYHIGFMSPHPVWITIFTSMFLHSGILHIAGNLWFLWIFGNNIEDVLGHVKFAIFYLFGGAAAAAVHILSNPMSPIPTLGASGAIAAVMGAYIVLFPNSRITTLVFFGFFVTTVAIPAVVVLGIWIFLQFSGVTGGTTPGGGGVAYWAHIGGFIAGVVGILLFGGRGLKRQGRPTFQGRYWYDD